MSFAEIWAEYQNAQAKFNDARERLWSCFVPKISDLTMKFLRDKRQNDDVTSPVLVSVFAHHTDELAKVQHPKELWDLCAAIALRHCNKHNKRRQRGFARGAVLPIGTAREGGSAGAAPQYDVADVQPTPEANAAQSELHQSCRDLIDQCEQMLTDQDGPRSARRLGVLGLHLEGKSRQEIAQALNTSVPTVDRDLFEIRAVLWKLFKAKNEDEVQ